MHNRFLALLVLASVTIASGCGDTAQEAGPAERADAEPASDAKTAAQIRLSADKTHAVQPGDVLTVTVEVTGVKLDGDGTGQTDAPGAGRYRIYLDDASGDAFLAESAEQQVEVTVPQDITDGSHELRAVLYNNDNTPRVPPAQAALTLIVYRL